MVSAAILVRVSTASPPLEPPQNSNLQTTKTELKTQKNRLNGRFFCEIWSECGDSNPGPPAPKAGALPTAQHPEMKLWNCPGGFSQSKRATNCATPGYEIFQLWSNMWSTPIFDQLPARGKVLSAQVSQGFPGFPRTSARTRASRSQSKRATNCATPGYFVGVFHFVAQSAFLL